LLIPHVDDHDCGYITNLKERKEKTPRSKLEIEIGTLAMELVYVLVITIPSYAFFFSNQT
jgi:hypothetical protein